MRTFYSTISAIVLAAYTSTLPGCVVADGSDVASSDDSQSASAALAPLPAPGKWDGQTLFAGLIFGTGPAATAIYPELVRTGTMPGVTKEQIVSSLKTASSSFAAKGFTEAASTMSEVATTVSATNTASYAETKVRPTAEQVASAQTAAIAAIAAIDSTFFTRFATAMQSGNLASVAKAMDEAASMAAVSSKKATGQINPAGGWWKYLDVAVAVEIVAVAVAVVFAFFGKAGGSDGGLQNDQFVLSVAGRLNPSILK